MSAALQLPARLDLTAAKPLHAALLSRRGADLVLDAGQVTHLGALGLQLLASAAQSWRLAGHALAIMPRTQAFDDALTVFGMPLDQLQTEPQP
ncbi:MAG: STAS domain-containing protein [Rhodobacteraceae bacterium]|nr:STAS domain-containing protein [Paracoccaceae bacterium]